MELTVNFTTPDQAYIDVVELYEDGAWVATVKPDEVIEILEEVIENDFDSSASLTNNEDYGKVIALKVALALLKEKVADL